MTTKWVLGHEIKAHPTTGDYDMVIGTTPPSVQGPPPHLHHSLNEVFLVIDGEMEFMCNGEMKTIKAGESVDLPPNTIHTFANKSDQPCKWVNIHSPKGFRKFFDSVGIDATEENAQERSLTPDIIQKVVEVAASFDMHIKM